MINSELEERFRHPDGGDREMIGVLHHLIALPVLSTQELVNTIEAVPFLNTSTPKQLQERLERVRQSQNILPIVQKEFVLDFQDFMKPEDKPVEMTFDQELRLYPSVDLIKYCYILTAIVDHLATSLNLPVRETYAAVARLGIQVCIHSLSNDDTAARCQAKKSLHYFAAIEMLALGIKTNAYQFAFVDPYEVNAEIFELSDQIIPVIKVFPGEDETKFIASQAYGAIVVSKNIGPLGGLNFHYLC